MKKILLLVVVCCLSFYGIAQTLTATPSTLSLPATFVGSTSSAMSSILTGSSLSPATGSIMVVAPTNFEVFDASASTWVSSCTIGYTGGTISSASVNVRFSPAAAGTFSDSVMLTGGGAVIPVYVNGTALASCSGTPSAGSVTASSYAFCSSGTASLSLTGSSTGAGITYQWQSSPSSGGTYTNISSATSSTFTFTVAATMYYRCVVTCITSGMSASTSPVMISYYGSGCPSLTAAPTSLTFPATVVGSSSSALNTVLNGTLLTPASGSLTITSSSGAFEVYDGSSWVPSYALSYTGASVSGSTIQVRFSPAAATSYTGNLSIIGGGALPINVILNGVGSSPCSGTPSGGSASSTLSIASTTTPFTLNTTGTTVAAGINVQWESSPTGSGSWSAISGATNASYTVSGITANTYYRLAVTCSYSSITSYSSTVMVSYAASCSGTPTAGTITATSYALCSTGAADTLTNSGYTYAAGIGLQWQSSPDSATWSNISGATNPTLIFAGASSRYYRCQVSCSFSGSSSSTAAVLVTFYGSTCPHVTASPTSITFPTTAPGSTSAPLYTVITGTLLSPSSGNLTVTGPSNFGICSTSGGSYTASYTIAYTGGAISATSVFVVFNAPSTTGSYSGNLSITGGGALTLNVPINGVSATTCTGTPSGGSASSSVTMAGTTTPVTLSATGYTATGSISLQWESSPDSATWSAISGATLATYSFTGITVSTYYRLVVTCTASSLSAYSTGRLITYATPCSGTPSAGTVSASATAVCTATSVTFTDAGYTVGAGITFQWQSSPSGSSWTNISGATNAAFTATIVSTTFYRCVVTCTTSGLSASTSTISVTYGVCATLAAAPTSLSFPATAASTTSSPLNTVLTGTYLSPASGNLTVTATSSDFEVSATAGGTYSGSYTIAYTGGTVTSNSIYVHFLAPATAGSYTGNVAVSGGGAVTLNVPLTAVSGCAGTPSGGTSSYTSTVTTCTTTTITLTNTGYTSTAGITLQWESSPTGSGSWAAISGATTATYTFTGALTPTYYRCVVTCTLSSLSSTSTTTLVNVDRINGHIAFSATVPDTLDMKVWLIYHNTSAGTLTAVDSVITCVDGTLPYYEFNGMGAGQFIVKAKSLDYTSTIVGASGIIPTYGLSNPHWDTAVTINHTNPIDTMHINMVSGIVPSGPGFIGGLITAGAGKNTAGDVPAVNMIVYLMDATRHVLTYTYTDASGNYAFSSLGYGSYIIYPEDLNYATTPSSVITLTASAASVTATNFRQRTTSKTIVPNLPSILPTEPLLGNDCILFPNPATEELTITSDEGAFDNVLIINSMGAVVLHKTTSRSKTILNVKELPSGIYSVKLTGTAGTVVKRFVKL